ncbi:UNVERIFIED_CONTAM: Trihelix transcription factor GT-3b [Sesamum calycinum]|uniref:Trihelix transcription factor GT-3b n=2 Tax=Sesamum TaxID=4181 RepID=A0AAE1W9N3_9LAMI|nr:Trihelix transcription factor GT-3b [Sesamum angolense]
MIPLPLPPFSAAGGGDDDEFPRRDERFPQWSNQETRDLIEIRAQIEWGFTTSKRNKSLWEMVANRMREKGYRRTIDQCKCKWKNLVSRYKGQDASDPENGRQCPFFDELHALFTARENRTQHAQPNLETSSLKGRKRLKNISGDRSHEEYSQERDDDEETGIDQAETGTVAPKRKAGGEKKRKTGQVEKQLNSNDGVLAGIQEMLGSFIEQQQRIDMQWKESMEKCAQERELLEQEWREKMEKLEREKLVMEQAWREREEQRRLREESRAEKRDALLTTLLNKLIHEEDS